MSAFAWRIARAALRRPATTHHYGEHPRQVADLHRPAGAGPFPVVVVLHGGYWQQPYTKLIMGPLCADLVRRGYAAFNVEYRRLGREGGGWPQTFDDVAGAIDHLADGDMRDARLDLARVTLLGHSAGGQLALWSAGRRELPAGAPGAGPRVVAGRVLALAAVCDLERAGRPAWLLLGGGPADVPERWAQADPMRRIPLGVPVGLVHARSDETVSVRRSRDYLAAARGAGADVTLAVPPGDHRDPIDPSSAAWRTAAQWLSAPARELGA